MNTPHVFVFTQVIHPSVTHFQHLEKYVNQQHDAPSHEMLSVILSAATGSTSRAGAVVLVPHGDGWHMATSVGTPPSVDYWPIRAWLRIVGSYGDIVILDDAEYDSVLATEDGVPSSLSVCLSLRGTNGETSAIALFYDKDRRTGLSIAQRYALKAYAVQLTRHLAGEVTHPPAAGDESLARLRMLESVVTNAKDAILITEAEPLDLPGPRIVYCNPSFLETTGYAEAEVLGNTPRILQCADTDRKALDKIRAALGTWTPIEIDLLNVKKDGTPFWVEVSIVPVADDRGWFTHWVSVQRDVTERKRVQALANEAQRAFDQRQAMEVRLRERDRLAAELSYRASHDALTGLKNRAALMNDLEQAFREASSGKSSVTLMFVDLDGFKLVNDSLGHVVGDQLLIEVSQRFAGHVGQAGTIARLGGDEFAILLHGTSDATDARHLAERIVRSLHTPISISGQSIVVSCSLGIARTDSSHQQPNDLVRDADIAMYEAKKLGKNRWVIFDLSMRNTAIRALALQSALRESVRMEAFTIIYQPVYRASDGVVTAVEALIRWNHPALGNVGPDVFIPIAEETGLIFELGEWVMRHACAQLERWVRAGLASDLTLNVNVSGVELLGEGFAERVNRILSQTHIPPAQLQLEVTESVFLHQPHSVALILDEIKQLGVRIALDDFGTGYSSLGYIDRYPIDAIKIDHSFISRMMIHSRSRAIVRSILSLGMELGLDITAEGVETSAQYSMLRDMACPLIQGFYLSVPLSAIDVAKVLSRS
jgi:diguanylate cyclase (GGDEF)-like protein/PAS domain S-box-containing protein